MNAVRAEHVAQARELLAEAAALDAEDRGSPADLSLLLEAQTKATLALVDAISELTEQASPTQDAVRVRALEAVKPR